MTDDANWKIFRRDTEAGRLLSRLYGVSSSSTQVNYPKQRGRRRVTISETSNDDECVENNTTTEALPLRRWRTTYSSHGWSKAAEEEREKERKNNIARALSLSVPKVGRGSKHSSRHSTMSDGKNIGLMIHAAKVDQIPRRRTEDHCRHDQEKVDFANKKYRPPASHATSSSEEKQRLADAFSKGGKCLPEDLTSIPAESSLGGDEVECNTSHLLANTLFDQIEQEILERRQYQMQLEEFGAGELTRDQIANEIRVRVEHLKKIEPLRATKVVQRLMKSS